MATVQGFCDEKFSHLKTLVQEFLDSGDELGLSIAVNVDGQDVVDIYGGFADAEKTKPWERDTSVTVFSSTKTIASLAVLILISRGLVKADDKVAKHWPEFGCNGKEDIEIRHLLSHTSGVAGFDESVTQEDLYDEAACVKRLETQAPWWTPGTASGYHSMTFGYLLGEVVRRVTGLGLREFVDQEIAVPLDADFQLGARESDAPRISTLIAPPPAAQFQLDPDSFTSKSLMNPVLKIEDCLKPGWRKAAIASANGHSNARGLARICSQVSLIGTARKDGEKTLLSNDMADLIFEEQSDGVDLCTLMHWRFGLGFAIRGERDETVLDKWLPPGRVCLWGGWGGSLIIMDLDRRVTIGYAMNKMQNEGPGTKLSKQYVKAVYDALGVQSTAGGDARA